jgi:hypothetical protein
MLPTQAFALLRALQQARLAELMRITTKWSLDLATAGRLKFS